LVARAAVGCLRLVALAVPVLVLTSRQVADRVPDPGNRLPPPHSVDLEGRHTEGLDFDVVAAQRASRAGLNAGLASGLAAPAGKAVAAGALASQVIGDRAGVLGGFSLVGSVAVLAADESMVTRKGTGYGITPGANLAAVTARFIQTFGDDYDQIAVFLAFPDLLSPNALAYLQPVKNDVKGLGIDVYDRTPQFGSTGRMQAVLNMKRINLYGRDAAGSVDSELYPVWAQEAAHRWLVYFRFQRVGEAVSTALLGRQMAHWDRGVQAQGSIMDGYDWKDNGDGTYTPGKRAVRYGELDQYGMGLRKAEEVSPFFLLKDLKDSAGTPISTMVGISAVGRYQATRVDLTIDDIIRAVGPRQPAMDVAAQDLRMGVMLLAEPEQDITALVGEATQIDNSRKLWTDFYNTAGGGRGKVCTDLLRPCRGDAFSFGSVLLEEAAGSAELDGVLGRGERFVLSVEVTHSGSGDHPVAASLTAAAAGLSFDPAPAAPMLAPGQTATIKLTGRVGADAVCGRPLTLDLGIGGARGPSRELRDTILGLVPKKVEGFEGDVVPAGWTVNPDGTDRGDAGRWAWGSPARSVFAFAGYTLQPGAPFSGQRAFVTGLSGEEIDNVEGKTTLESAPFPLAGLRAPTLSYEVYFVSTDFQNEVLVPAPPGALKVQASIDGGSFTEVDVVTGMSTGWQRRLVPLADKLGAGVKTGAEVRLRFVAEENTESTHPVVEVALDDVGIYDEAASCSAAVLPAPGDDAGPTAGGPADGCGCTLGARPDRRDRIDQLRALGLVAAVTLFVRRRRRTPKAPRGPWRS
jgi:MYXO-CTERM domain-containing protein